MVSSSRRSNATWRGTLGGRIPGPVRRPPKEQSSVSLKRASFRSRSITPNPGGSARNPSCFPRPLRQGGFHKDALFEPLARHAGRRIFLTLPRRSAAQGGGNPAPSPEASPAGRSVWFNPPEVRDWAGSLEPAFFLPACVLAALLSGASSSRDSGSSDAAPVHRPGNSGQRRLLAVAAAGRAAGGALGGPGELPHHAALHRRHRRADGRRGRGRARAGGPSRLRRFARRSWCLRIERAAIRVCGGETIRRLAGLAGPA